MKNVTLNLALHRNTYAKAVPEKLDNYIFITPIDDLTSVITMEDIAEVRLLQIFKTKEIQETKKWYQIEPAYRHVNINLYMTGHVSMLLAVLNVCRSFGIKVTCYIYDKKTETYFPQEVY